VTVINITAATSGGTLAAQAEGFVVLRTGGDYGGGHNGSVIGNKEHFTLDNNGEIALDLAPNSEITPEGTVYLIQLLGAKFYIEVPDSGGPYDLGDTDIWTVSTPPAVQIQGVPGGSGYVDTLANLTTLFATEPDNTYGSATDVNGGTLFANDGGTPVQMAPGATETGIERLASATLGAAANVTITTGATMYRVTSLTTGSFVMPSTPVEARLFDMRCWETGTGDASKVTTQVMQLRYTTDGWATSSPITGRLPAQTLGTSIFYINIWHQVGGTIGASAGATVQVGAFITHADSGATVQVIYSALDDPQRTVPHLSVWG
jgi:hypothetical protein